MLNVKLHSQLLTDIFTVCDTAFCAWHIMVSLTSVGIPNIE